MQSPLVEQPVTVALETVAVQFTLAMQVAPHEVVVASEVSQPLALSESQSPQPPAQVA